MTHDFSVHRKATLHDYYHGIHGVRLRQAALAVLLAVGSCSMDEMWTCLNGRHRLDPSVTKKSLADALRYECVKGRPIVGRGEIEEAPLHEEERRRSNYSST